MRWRPASSHPRKSWSDRDQRLVWLSALPWHHRDPFDRLLIAQASLEAHALVSADARMAAYDVETVW